jgi:hypothetical protein
MLYRVNKELTTGEVPGDIISDRQLQRPFKNALVRKGIITRLDSPPLDYLDGWKRRAELLEPLGVYTIVDFLEADEDAIRRAFGHKTLRGVNKAKEYLWTLMDVPSAARRRG